MPEIMITEKGDDKLSSVYIHQMSHVPKLGKSVGNIFHCLDVRDGKVRNQQRRKMHDVADRYSKCDPRVLATRGAVIGPLPVLVVEDKPEFR